MEPAVAPQAPARPAPPPPPSGPRTDWRLPAVGAVALIAVAALLFVVLSRDDSKEPERVRQSRALAQAQAVPDVRGQGLASARRALRDTGLSVEIVERSSTEPVGTVVRQDPSAGVRVEDGAVVTLTIARADASPSESPPPPPSTLSLEDAIAKVRAESYTASNASSDWRPDNTLKVLVGVATGSADGYNKRAFFFVGSRYIGTDTSEPSAQVRVADQQDREITLVYARYGPDDPFCCPTGGDASVRYQWNGARLTPLDPIPRERERGG